jgi:hypothetical protein
VNTTADSAKNYKWCFQCEHASPKKKLRAFVWQGMAVKGCPNPACNGTDLDFWKWSEVRMKEGQPRYPEIPKEGVKYPLY